MAAGRGRRRAAPRKVPDPFNDGQYGRHKQGENELSRLLETFANDLTVQAREPDILGYKPHEKQVIFHESTAKSKLYIGGNRSGKTTGGVTEDLWWATKRHPYRHRDLPDGPIRGRVIGVDFSNGVATQLLPAFKRWVTPSDLVNGSWTDSWSGGFARTLNFANGSFIEFKSYEQDLDAHSGTSRHFIHMDEEPPENIFKENLLRLIDVGGSWWITMTPVEGMTWTYYKLIEPVQRGIRTVPFIINIDTDENPYLSAEAKAEAWAFLTESDVAARKSGRHTPKGGRVFDDFIDRYPWVIEKYTPVKDDRIYVSIDHGWNNPSAIMWHAVNSAGRVTTFHERYINKVLIEENAKYILEYNKTLPKEVELTVGDPALKQTSALTGTSPWQEYSRHGVAIAVDNIPRNVQIGIDKMQSYLKLRNDQPTWRMTKDCPALIRELSLYSWKVPASGKIADRQNSLQEPNKKDDHAIDSSRYFFTLIPDLSFEEEPTLVLRPAKDDDNIWMEARQLEGQWVGGEAQFISPYEEGAW